MEKQNPTKLDLLYYILKLENERGMLDEYRREIIGVGCYDHQDISYTIRVQQIHNPKEIMVVPVTDKADIFLLRKLYGFKDKYVYARCTRCPSIPTIHNTLAIISVVVISLCLVYYFIMADDIYIIVLSSFAFWGCAVLMMIYNDNCKLEKWVSSGIYYWALIVDNFMKWYWFVFWVVSAYYMNNLILGVVMLVVAFAWIIVFTQVINLEIQGLIKKTNGFHKIMGVRVPYRGDGFPYGE